MEKLFGSFEYTSMSVPVSSSFTKFRSFSESVNTYLLQDSDRCGIFAPIRKLRRVVKNQEGKDAVSGKSLARAGKMTRENIGFADPFVAKEAVGRLGAGPVLTCPRRGRTYSV